jgi:hypothetical protein
MQFKTGQTEQNVDAFLEWDGKRQYVAYLDESSAHVAGAAFYYSDESGGGDETFESLAERIAVADGHGVLSQTDRIIMAHCLHKRLKDQGETFESMVEAARAND